MRVEAEVKIKATEDICISMMLLGCARARGSWGNLQKVLAANELFARVLVIS